MTLLQKVKLHLRITHNALDDEIQDTIDACLIDMQRIGISQASLTEPDALLTSAIKTFVACEFEEDTDKRESLHNAYMSKVDGIRKSFAYRSTEEVIE